MNCRYLEKVLPSPYGPRLPWWFPFSRSYWATGDVEDSLHAMAPVHRLCSRLKKLLRLKVGEEDTVAYQQVRSTPCFCEHNASMSTVPITGAACCSFWTVRQCTGRSPLVLAMLVQHSSRQNHRCMVQWWLRQVTLLQHHGESQACINLRLCLASCSRELPFRA